MKLYVMGCDPLDPPFVTTAETPGEAIAKRWQTTCDPAESHYEVHLGRWSEAKTVSSAEALPYCDERTARRAMKEIGEHETAVDVYMFAKQVHAMYGDG
ncbi:hypothetical protein FYK55_10230 [Roseiconus nitratireducens]|uniref:Uncharacterized protein n=1 Tax=Roseiconus nitratireducens TaxID=2605748 RepID=A0A5M6D8B2_9BACT|nr:hypothetical protein [Roseiconus nitratireducens]KAA5543583.1 hypothetical protein FYK55_10230 [Roseiconus nitratireducens]